MIAAWTVYCKIDALFFMIAAAYSSALTTFVGQIMELALYKSATGNEICIGMLSISAIFLSICLMTFVDRLHHCFQMIRKLF